MISFVQYNNCMNGTIVYLHGFASSGNSKKSQVLKAHFGHEQVYAPDLPIDPEQTIAIVEDIVAKVTTYPLIFVGTSLGGFWANYFAQKYDAIAVLVNPSTRPEVTMQTRIGIPLTNYSTGEPILVTQDHVDKFSKYKSEAEALYNGSLVHAFLAMDDETLDYKIALQDLQYFKTCTMTPDGGHRYDVNWPKVVEQIDKILNSN